VRCPQPDWLDHRLTVTGPWEEYRDFRRTAAGAGVAGWVLDYDRLEESLVLLMLAQPLPPGVARIPAAGARHVARGLRELVWQDHEAALARVGVDRRCPFDLNALVPVPWEVLRLGEDDPQAIAWMWAHWGTTWPLRRVELRALPPPRLAALPAEHVGCELRFWSADWSPWPVLAECRRRWPALRFGMRVEYWWGVETGPPSVLPLQGGRLARLGEAEMAAPPGPGSTARQAAAARGGVSSTR